MYLKDDGGGITSKSLKFWNENKNNIGFVFGLEASVGALHTEKRTENGVTYFVEYNCKIYGYKGDILLSGCNCGYGGTGPNGTAKILAELGVPIDKARTAMLYKHLEFSVLSNTLILDGQKYPLLSQEDKLKYIVMWNRGEDEAHYVVCNDRTETETLLAELSGDALNEGITCYELGAKLVWEKTITVKITS